MIVDVEVLIMEGMQGRFSSRVRGVLQFDTPAEIMIPNADSDVITSKATDIPVSQEASQREKMLCSYIDYITVERVFTGARTSIALISNID